MSEAQKVYLAIYAAAIQGWLANKNAKQGGELNTAVYAHSIANHAAQLGIIALAKVGKQEPA